MKFAKNRSRAFRCFPPIYGLLFYPMKKYLFLIIALLLALPAYAQDVLPDNPFEGGFDSPLGGGMDAGFGAGFNSKRESVKVSADFITEAGNPSKGVLRITAEIPVGFHMYSITQKDGGPTAAKITIKPSDKFTLAGSFTAQNAPEVQTVDYYPVPMEEHRGTVVWTAPIQFNQGVNPNDVEIKGDLYYQICDDINGTCLEPTASEFSADYDDSEQAPASGVAPSAPETIQDPNISDPKAQFNSQTQDAVAAADAQSAPSKKAHSTRELIVWSFMAFLGGLILNVMPCVLPVISLKLMAFIEQAGESRVRVFILNLWYVAGLMIVFVFLAFLSTYGVSLFSGKLSTESGMGWGEMYSYTWVQMTMCAFIFVMALSMLGVWEIPIPGFLGSGAVNDIQQKEGAIGAFTKGIFTTLLAVPCVGPFLGPVLGAVMGEPLSFTLLIFSMIGLGMGAPYILVGLFPELLSFLPKPGAWMVTVREFMGFLLLATTVYFFRMAPGNLMVPLLSLLFALWFLCWIVNKIPFDATVGQKMFNWSLGLFVAGLTGFGMFHLYTVENTFPWSGEFNAQNVAKEHAAGRVVMIEFTADWCPNCKANMTAAIQREEVAQLIRDKNIYAVVADWSRKPADPNAPDDIKTALHSFGRQSIPLLVILPPGEAKPILLDGLITKNQLLKALNQAVEQANSAADSPTAPAAPVKQINQDVKQAYGAAIGN